METRYNFWSFNWTADELAAVRRRFMDGQSSVGGFVQWLDAHMIDDFRWLLGVIDGYVENEMPVATEVGGRG